MTARHDGDAGDVIYSLPCVRAFTREHGPIRLALNPCTRDHPHGGKHFHHARAEWLLPLLRAQSYVAAADLWDGTPVDIDLNLVRRLPINYFASDIAGWYRWAFPVAYDLSEPWLHTDAEYHGRLVVGRSPRWRNDGIHYEFMAGHAVLFVGLDDEYTEFRRSVPDAEYAPVADALALARLIAGARAFVGNQSLPYAIAEGLKVPRLLEVCPKAPNVIPHGPGGHDAVTSLGFESNFYRLRGPADA
jgi:hypothetical protein